MADLLRTQSLRKEYRRSRWARAPSFVLQADLAFVEPAIIGVLGPNGSGKTTLFELITGSNAPTAGSVQVGGQDIHRVRRNQRGQLARHYHQSYQIRRFRSWKPDADARARSARRGAGASVRRAAAEYAGRLHWFHVALFSETAAARPVALRLPAPTGTWQLDLLREIAESFVFVEHGQVTRHPTFEDLVRVPGARDYLGHLIGAE